MSGFQASRKLEMKSELRSEIDASQDRNEFSPLMGQIIRIDTEGHKLPLFGRLIGVSDQFLTVERVDGRVTVVRRKAVVTAEPVKNQQGPKIAPGAS